MNNPNIPSHYLGPYSFGNDNNAGHIMTAFAVPAARGQRHYEIPNPSHPIFTKYQKRTDIISSSAVYINSTDYDNSNFWGWLNSL